MRRIRSRLPATFESLRAGADATPSESTTLRRDAGRAAMSPMRRPARAAAGGDVHDLRAVRLRARDARRRGVGAFADSDSLAVVRRVDRHARRFAGPRAGRAPTGT